MDNGTTIKVNSGNYLGKRELRLFNYGAAKPYPSIGLMGADSESQRGAAPTEHYYHDEKKGWMVKTPMTGKTTQVKDGMIEINPGPVAPPRIPHGGIKKHENALRIYQLKKSATSCATVEKTADYYPEVTAMTSQSKNPNEPKMHEMAVTLKNNDSGASLGSLRASVIDGMESRVFQKSAISDSVNLNDSKTYDREGCAGVKEQKDQAPTLTGEGGLSGKPEGEPAN
jgi:hypothetical protein